MKTARNPVTIRTRTVGQSFGCEGQIVAANGRVLASTDAYPLGMAHRAREAAESLAAKMGLTVRESE